LLENIQLTLAISLMVNISAQHQATTNLRITHYLIGGN